MTPIVEPRGIGSTSGLPSGLILPRRAGSSIDAYTSVLLHMDGTNGSTTFNDATGKTWLVFGSAQISTAQTKFGTAVGDFVNGNIALPYHVDITFGTGAFTIDFWVYPTALDATYRYFAYQYIDDNNFFRIRTTNGNIEVKHIVAASSKLDIYTGNSVLTANQWNHVAIARQDSANAVVYVNGNSKALTVNTSAAGQSLDVVNAAYRIGGTWSGDAVFDGYLDEYRISKGIARWTANFTPPTAAY